MKKLLLTAIVMLALISCSKEVDSTATFDENTIAKRLKFVDVNSRISVKTNAKTKTDILIVEWDEWGRASKLCDGWGLCNADWFPSSSKLASKVTSGNGGASILEFDASKKKYFIDILLAETVPSDIPKEVLTFKIDADFELNVQLAVGQSLTFHQGNYNFDDSLGKFGGYRIYLD